MPQAEDIDKVDWYTELSLADSQPDNGGWGSAACSSLLTTYFSIDVMDYWWGQPYP